MNGLNKTVFASIAVSCVTLLSGVLILGYWYIGYLKTIDSTNIKMDRFTNCIQVVMQKSIESNQPIDAEKAKDICVHTKETKA